MTQVANDLFSIYLQVPCMGAWKKRRQMMAWEELFSHREYGEPAEESTEEDKKVLIRAVEAGRPIRIVVHAGPNDGVFAIGLHTVYVRFGEVFGQHTETVLVNWKKDGAGEDEADLVFLDPHTNDMVIASTTGKFRYRRLSLPAGAARDQEARYGLVKWFAQK